MKEFAEKLIDKLGDEYLSQDMRDWNNAILRAVQIVEQLAEEYEREHIVDLCNQICNKVDSIIKKDNNGWIPCSEKLPSEKGKYLVTVKNLTGFWILEEPVFVCDYEFDTFIFQGWEDNDVIAWKPLPKPYKELTR